MARRDTVTTRVNEDEREKWARVAEHLRRSLSDTARVLIEEKYAAIAANGDTAHKAKPEPVQAGQP